MSHVKLRSWTRKWGTLLVLQEAEEPFKMFQVFSVKEAIHEAKKK